MPTSKPNHTLHAALKHVLLISQPPAGETLHDRHERYAAMHTSFSFALIAGNELKETGLTTAIGHFLPLVSRQNLNSEDRDQLRTELTVLVAARSRLKH